jgi:peptidyl-prolyl cis-trans isomerase C
VTSAFGGIHSTYTWSGIVLACLIALIGAAGCSPGTDESPVQTRYRSEGGRRKFLDDLISRELLLQEARRLGLDQTPAAIERLERAKEQLALDELIRAAVKIPVDPTPEELESYYALHQDELHGAEHIRAAHILVRSESQARDLKRQLDQGADFGRLAQRYSLDHATRQRGGDLGPYRKGVTEPELDAVLSALKPGMVSDPVETASGVHLVKLLSRERDASVDTVAVRERLRQELYAEKQRQRFEALLARLRKTAAIKMAEASRFVTEDGGRATASPAP